MDRDQGEREFSREIEAHLELEAAELESRGVAPDAARAAARRAFGNVTAVRERFYESRRWRWLDRLRRDLGFALRSLRASPGFTLTAIVTLAGGIGFNTALFTLLYSFGVRPLPVRHPDEVATLYQRFTGEVSRMVNGSIYMLSWDEYQAYRDGNRRFASLVAHAQTDATLGGAETISVRATLASCNYFSALEVRIARGRGFVADECRAGSSGAVAVLSDGLWRRRFGADPGVVGQVISLNQLPFTVIGIAEPGFGGVDIVAADLWVPVTTQPLLSHGQNDQLPLAMSWLNVLGRLRPGVSTTEAEADLSVTAHRLDAMHPKMNAHVQINRATLANNPEIRERGGVIALGILGLGLVVVLIACANLMNLLLARALARRREFGVRMALGAGRGRLIEQLVAESLLLAIAGGAAGLLIAVSFPRFVLGLLPVTGLQLDLHPDLRILSFALATSILAAFVFGLAPAFRATSLSLTSAMRNDAGGAHGPGASSRLRGLVVAIQMGGSALLLMLAGLFVRGMQQVATMDPGFATRGVVAVSVNPGELGYDGARSQAVFDELTDRFGALPGITSTAIVSRLPLLGRSSNVVRAERPGKSPTELELQVDFLVASGSYFTAMSVPLVRGRAFTRAESADSGERGAVVSERFAREAWGSDNPIGQRFKDGRQEYFVTGIARDVHNVSLGEPDRPFVYFPQVTGGATGDRGLTILLRSARPTTDLLPLVAPIVHRVDPALALRVETIEDRMGLVALPTRLAGIFAGLFGLLALVMGVIGVYGVVSYGIGQRRREIGIRLALGATTRRVTSLVVRQGAWVAGGGVAIGLLLAAGASQLVRALLFGLSPLDPVAFIGVTALLAGAAALALYAPARRAAGIDPAVTLREE